jgi:hypothetical protein
MLSKEEALHDLLDTTESLEIIKIFEKTYEMDDQSDEKKGDYLINLYRNGTPKNRSIIDDVFITLCGWSLQSLCLKLKK